MDGGCRLESASLVARGRFAAPDSQPAHFSTFHLESNTSHTSRREEEMEEMDCFAGICELDKIPGQNGNFQTGQCRPIV